MNLENRCREEAELDNDQQRNPEDQRTSLAWRAYIKAVDLDRWVQKRFDAVAHAVMRKLGVTRGFLFYASMVGSNVLGLAADSIGPRGITTWSIVLMLIVILLAHLNFWMDDLAGDDRSRDVASTVFGFFLALKYWAAFLILFGLIKGVIGPRAVGSHAISMSRFIGASIVEVVARAAILCGLYLMFTPKQPPPRKEKEAKESVQALQPSAT